MFTRKPGGGALAARIKGAWVVTGGRAPLAILEGDGRGMVGEARRPPGGSSLLASVVGGWGGVGEKGESKKGE